MMSLKMIIFTLLNLTLWLLILILYNTSRTSVLGPEKSLLRR